MVGSEPRASPTEDLHWTIKALCVVACAGQIGVLIWFLSALRDTDGGERIADVSVLLGVSAVLTLVLIVIGIFRAPPLWVLLFNGFVSTLIFGTLVGLAVSI